MSAQEQDNELVRELERLLPDKVPSYVPRHWPAFEVDAPNRTPRAVCSHGRIACRVCALDAAIIRLELAVERDTPRDGVSLIFVNERLRARAALLRAVIAYAKAETQEERYGKVQDPARR